MLPYFDCRFLLFHVLNKRQNSYCSRNVYATEMQEIIREGSLAHRKAFIRSFVKDIRVSGDQAMITYSIPEVPENVSLREVGVPPIAQRGGRYWT